MPDWVYIIKGLLQRRGHVVASVDPLAAQVSHIRMVLPHRIPIQLRTNSLKNKELGRAGYQLFFTRESKQS